MLHQQQRKEREVPQVHQIAFLHRLEKNLFDENHDTKESKQTPSSQMKLAKSLLKTQFSHTEFLKGQEEVLKLLFQGKNACAIFPTGYLEKAFMFVHTKFWKISLLPNSWDDFPWTCSCCLTSSFYHESIVCTCIFFMGRTKWTI